MKALLFLLLTLLLPLTVRADAVLVFNEIMYHPATNESEFEWIELRNVLAVDVDISDWSIAGGIDYKFPSNTIVKAGDFLLVAASPTAMRLRAGAAKVLGPFSGRLGNSGDRLRLLNNSGRLMDEVNYGIDDAWPVAPDGAGVSLAKLDPDLASRAAIHWRASEEFGGTPGSLNFSKSVLPPVPLLFHEVSAANHQPFFVELAHDAASPISSTNFIIRHDGSTDHIVHLAPANLLPGAATPFLATNFGFAVAVGDNLYLEQIAPRRILDAVKVGDRSRGRYPEVGGAWTFPDAVSPGASNVATLETGIVINEIMYRPAASSPTNDSPRPRESRTTWVELYNRSTRPIEIGGWAFDGGIRYRFNPGQSIPAGGYLVLANNANALRQAYPNITVVGDFQGQLSGKSDHLVLKNSAGNLVDEVGYFDGGRWPEYADGGGSSLELRDPYADNAVAEAWAASDESDRQSWQTISYRMVAAPSVTPAPDNRWRDFVFGLLGDGEILIDDISVVESPDGDRVQYVANGNFEAGLAGWRAVGNHGQSRVIVDPQNQSNHFLDLVATGAQEHMHNHVEATIPNSLTVNIGRTYEVTYRAKPIAGNTLLNTRFYFNRVAQTTALARDPGIGTPGRANSRRESNIGPTFHGFGHSPIVPVAGEPVLISVSAEDPQGVAACDLLWSVDGAPFTRTSMRSAGSGRYSVTLPGQSAGAIVQFYVSARDGSGAEATFPAKGPSSGALYRVDDGAVANARSSGLTVAHSMRLLLTPANTALLHANTNVMSNQLLPCTVIYDETHAYYDAAIHLKSSERGRNVPVRVGFHLVFPSDDLFRGVHPVMVIDRSRGSGPPNEEMLIRHMITRAAGIPGVYPDLCLVLAPQSAMNGAAILAPRFEDDFIETAFERGGEGTLFELELIYFPLSATPDGFKLPQPDGVQGVDITDLGNAKENYRYNFIIKNHRDVDDYSRWIDFAKSWSLTGEALESRTQATTDIDEWIRAYALTSLAGVWDMYTFAFSHNLMAYVRPVDGRVLYLPWDMDYVFGRPANSPLIGGSNLGKLISSLPANLRRYYGQVHDHLDTVFNEAYMGYWIKSYGATIAQDYSARLVYIRSRSEFAHAQIRSAGGYSAFAVTGTNSITRSGRNFVRLTGIAPVTLKTIKVNGLDYPMTWSTVSTWQIELLAPEAATAFELLPYDLHDQPIAELSTTIRANGQAPASTP